MRCVHRMSRKPQNPRSDGSGDHKGMPRSLTSAVTRPPRPHHSCPCTADSFTRNAATLTRTSPTPVRAPPRVARRRGSFGTQRQCLIEPIRGRKMPIDRGLHVCQTMALRCSRPARPRTGFTSNNHLAPLERDEGCPHSASALDLSSPEGHAPRKDGQREAACFRRDRKSRPTASGARWRPWTPTLTPARRSST